MPNAQLMLSRIFGRWFHQSLTSLTSLVSFNDI